MIVHIEGLKELDDALAALPEATAKNVLRRILREAGQPIDDAWRQAAPVLSGELSKSGGVSTKLTRRQASSAKEGKSYVEIYVGPGPNPQSVLQEFGTATQPPQPYLRPAWESNKERALDIIVNGLRGEILKAATRLAKKRAKAGA
jgi:HK97 gp10 family phage protein